MVSELCLLEFPVEISRVVHRGQARSAPASIARARKSNRIRRAAHSTASAGQQVRFCLPHQAGQVLWNTARYRDRWRKKSLSADVACRLFGGIDLLHL